MLTFQPCCILAMFQNIGQQRPVPLFTVGFGSQFSRHHNQPFVLFRNAIVQFPDFPALKTLQSKWFIVSGSVDSTVARFWSSSWLSYQAKVCWTAFSVKKKLRKKCINPSVNVLRQMRVILAFKMLRQKVRKSPRQYFATKVRKLRFQILKTEHTVPDQ